EAVDLVHDHRVDLAALDVVHEPRERRALEVAACEAAVVVARGQRLPALGGLALDEVFGRLALRVERVEVGVEPLGRRLARVDRAADDLRLLHERRAHAAAFAPTLKNKKPFQREPAIFVASVERLAKRSPRYSKPSVSTRTSWTSPRNSRRSTVPTGGRRGSRALVSTMLTLARFRG